MCVCVWGGGGGGGVELRPSSPLIYVRVALVSHQTPKRRESGKLARVKLCRA